MIPLCSACRYRSLRSLAGAVAALSTVLPSIVLGDPAGKPLEIDIAHTSIEDLLNTNISSVSKTDERLIRSPAAVYVINNEEIRRSGARSIPEALRLVPGVQVARVDANKWAVSIRGFNSGGANKLQVLIDGRSVYELLYSGVFWESKDVMLDDVERIEVIRGPGGTLWGSNAVNGVINIITKSAKDTTGGFVSGGGGTEERGFGSARYGVELTKDHYLRVYGKYDNRDSGFLPQGADDESWFGQGGFRYDGNPSTADSLTFQGDDYDGRQGAPDDSLTRDQRTYGRNALFRWKHTFSSTSDLTLLSYYDYTKIDTSVLAEDRNTGVTELQFVFEPLSWNRVVAGAHYRYGTDTVRNSEILGLAPRRRADHLTSAFIEDRLELLPETVFFTIGSKFEENDYSGFEVQPTARLSWQVDDDSLFWGAISRAVRVPTRLETDFIISFNGTTFTGNRDLDSEEVLAYEVGYRRQLLRSVYFDVATFYNDYDRLETTEGTTLGNHGKGYTYGVETTVRWQPIPEWALEGSYSLLRMHLVLDEESLDSPATSVKMIEGNNPRNQFSVLSRISLTSQWRFDSNLRYVDNLPASGVRSYVVADVRLSYTPRKYLNLSVVGQNLLEGHHLEQGGAGTTEVQSGVYGVAQVYF